MASTINIPVRHIQGNPKEPGLSGSFGIRKVEEILGGSDMVENLHRHDFFYMLILTKGLGSHKIDFIPYEVSDNTLFLMRPGQVHELTLKTGSKGYLVQFKNDFFYSQNPPARELLRKVSHRKICTLEENNFERLASILDSIYKEFMDKLEGFEEVIKSNLNIFFVELVRYRQNTEKKPVASNQYPQEKLEKFFDLLDENITDVKQVSGYANKLNLSTYQLGSITKSLLGKTPSDLINEHIILESKRQLLATSNQVNQIAYHLGYDDVSYFIRFFKKHTNHTPESFRNISR